MGKVFEARTYAKEILKRANLTDEEFLQLYDTAKQSDVAEVLGIDANATVIIVRVLRELDKYTNAQLSNASYMRSSERQRALIDNRYSWIDRKELLACYDTWSVSRLAPALNMKSSEMYLLFGLRNISLKDRTRPLIGVATAPLPVRTASRHPNRGRQDLADAPTALPTDSYMPGTNASLQRMRDAMAAAQPEEDVIALLTDPLVEHIDRELSGITDDITSMSVAIKDLQERKRKLMEIRELTLGL